VGIDIQVADPIAPETHDTIRKAADFLMVRC